MNRNLKAIASLLIAAAVTVAYAQPVPVPQQRRTSIQQEIEALQEQMNQQTNEINSLRRQLDKRNAELQQAQSRQPPTDDQTQAVTSLQTAVQQMKEQDASLAATVAENQIKAVKKSALSPLAFERIKLGVTFYGDFVHYTDTNYGPQFLTQMNQEGPGNAGFNSFDITRTYLNFLYTPSSDVTLRITPNIYRQVSGGVSGDSGGANATIAAAADGNLTYRLKYAYIQFNHPFKGSKTFGKGNIRIGQTMNPLVDWQEGLYQYRFVNLTPWNYLSLSSTYVGAEMNGPVMHNNKEYLDYQFGVFNDTSFHHIEASDTKSFMERLTFYPTGTKSDRTGFGITEFNLSGYNNKTPSTRSTYTDTLAIIGFYQSHDHKYEIAGEYDYGQNAFNTGNLFSGVGPSSGPVADLSSAILSGTTYQKGFDFYGHAALDHKGKFKLIGMFQNFQPNTNFSGTNPYDFNRTVGGIAYQYNKYLTFAFDDQNLTYYHKQFDLSQSQLSAIGPSLGANYATGMSNVVPGSTNGIFMNLQFNY